MAAQITDPSRVGIVCTSPPSKAQGNQIGINFKAIVVLSTNLLWDFISLSSHEPVCDSFALSQECNVTLIPKMRAHNTLTAVLKWSISYLFIGKMQEPCNYN